MAAMTSVLPNRAFGVVVVLTLLAYAALAFWHDGQLPIWPLPVALVVLVPTLLRPGLLAPFTSTWLKLGMLMHAVVSPVVLGLVFFGMLTPIAVLRRLRGHDALALRLERDAGTYWIDRDPPGPQASALFRQY